MNNTIFNKPLALFLILPFPSHYLATLDFARSWQKKGYEVVFATPFSFKEWIEKEGFSTSEFTYYQEYKVDTIRILLGLFLKSLVEPQFTRLRYREWYTNTLSINGLISQRIPEIVFIDEHLSNYYLFIKPFLVPCYILNTKLSVKKNRGIPPLNSCYLPSQNIISRWYSEVLWIKNFLKLKFQNLIQWVAFLGKNERYFQERYCNKNGFSRKSIFEENTTFGRGVKGLSTIILAPKELEFSFKESKVSEIYFNMTLTRNEDNYKTSEYNNLTRKILKLKNEHDVKIAYCAFGTLGIENSTDVICFLEKLIESTLNIPNVFLVIAKGNIPFNISESKNVKIFEAIPQIDFLKYADIMITHGGLTTLKECYHANVPVLVYPLNTKIDQNGNAARVVSRGWGLRGILKNDSPLTIRTKIVNLLTKKCYSEEVNGFEKNITQNLEIFSDLDIPKVESETTSCHATSPSTIN